MAIRQGVSTPTHLVAPVNREIARFLSQQPYNRDTHKLVHSQTAASVHKKGVRPTNEDRSCYIKGTIDIAGKPTEVRMAGVFDGHGGQRVSTVVSETLFNCLIFELQKM
ncbi:hypothetical protein EBR96_02050, partial [bacterium]|nr:hypothetical protein [bacterium]